MSDEIADYQEQERKRLAQEDAERSALLSVLFSAQRLLAGKVQKGLTAAQERQIHRELLAEAVARAEQTQPRWKDC